MSQFKIQPPPNTISFHSFNSDWVMRITADRRIEVNEGVDVSEAAQKVLDAMQTMLDVQLERAVLEEREACAKVCENGINNATDWDSSAWDQACENRSYAIRARGQA